MQLAAVEIEQICGAVGRLEEQAAIVADPPERAEWEQGDALPARLVVLRNESTFDRIRQDRGTRASLRVDPMQEHAIALMLDFQDCAVGETTDVEAPLLRRRTAESLLEGRPA